ncbi:MULTISPECIES: hypothetical protein [Gammaproteobacteria]|uniref:hypothetical protein n=1 Tax=Gammaproteobacteria TaxID=1236 RepID=UPI000DCFFAAF|nr:MULTISPECIES: hypothetical protein [Gammaproteobacteria]RTE86187.1 hypothetical protein DQX04_06345 [Aliidiomarina sp. B3213]TCZ91539.1 hypothetical protein EYQ95_06355 [Lysobacter sp. N42]
MKTSKWYILILVLVIIVSPLHWYSKWQLKHFEYGGVVGFIASVFYTPSDFRDVLWSGMLYPNETYNLSLSHNYLGGHEVRVVYDLTTSASTFDVHFSCESGFYKQFKSSHMGNITSSERTMSPVAFGGYQVSDLSDFENCAIKIDSDTLDGPFFVYFRKGYPL